MTSKKREPGSDGQDSLAVEQWKQRVEMGVCLQCLLRYIWSYFNENFGPLGMSTIIHLDFGGRGEGDTIHYT